MVCGTVGVCGMWEVFIVQLRRRRLLRLRPRDAFGIEGLRVALLKMNVRKVHAKSLEILCEKSWGLLTLN